MSVNSSSSSNGSIPAPQPSFLHDFDMFGCFYITTGSSSSSIIVYTVVNDIVLLPLFTLVLYMLARRWWQQPRRMMSHSDVLTGQIMVAELIGIVAITLIFCGSVSGRKATMLTGINAFIAYQFIAVSLYVLTCVERYMAVVHPTTYVGLRKEKGSRIRNAGVCWAWLLSFIEGGIAIYFKPSLSICSTAVTTLNLVVVSFCSLSVLRVLYRPRPGAEGGSRQVDAFKLRAFYTIFVVLGVLLLRYGFHIFATAIISLSGIDEYSVCVFWMSGFWFSLPSRLVAPLLFLHREGKLLGPNRRLGQ